MHPEGVGRRILFISLDLGEGSGEGREQKIGRQSKAGGFMDGPFEVLGGALGASKSALKSIPKSNHFLDPFLMDSAAHLGSILGPHLGLIWTKIRQKSNFEMYQK